MSAALLRIRSDQDRVHDLDHLVHRQVRAVGVFADRLGAARLVDADRADRSAALVEDVAADPADVVGHLLVSDLPGALGGHLEVSTGLPAAASQNRVGIHMDSISPRPASDESIQPLSRSAVNAAGTDE